MMQREQIIDRLRSGQISRNQANKIAKSLGLPLIAREEYRGIRSASISSGTSTPPARDNPSDEEPDNNFCGCGRECVDGEAECEKCLDDTRRAEWKEAMLESVRALCLETGWECDIWPRGASSWYGTVTSPDGHSLKVRISDHGSAYCTEDISLAMNPSGDDSTLSGLASLMQRESHE